MNKYPDLIYIGRSRLHRNRANLIQTLHTVAAFVQNGIQTSLYLPPWHRNVTLKQKLDELGITTPLDIHPVQSLHRRWPVGLFVSLYKRRLRNAKAIYVRSPEISLSLAAQGITHNFEIHTLRSLIHQDLLSKIIQYHQAETIAHLFPISRASADLLIEAGANPARVHICPSGVDLAAYRTIPEFDATRVANPRIIYLGRISHDRGLTIFTRLAEAGLGEILLVGQRDDDIPQQLGLSYQPSVPHKNVPSLYAHSDLVLLPYQPELSHADGISPLKLFEAMAAGRPIIASDLPPIREVLRHGYNALLVSPNDLDGWIEAVKSLKQDPTLAKNLSNQALEDVSAYSWLNRAKHIADSIGLRH